MRRVNDFQTYVGVSLVVLGCATRQAEEAPPKTGSQSGEPGTAHEPGPVGTKLMSDVTESKDVYEIGPGGGTGMEKFSVMLNGKMVWPPQGEGCERLVKCCNDLATLAEPLALSCLLATARDKNCTTAMATAVGIAQEQSYQLPPACAP